MQSLPVHHDPLLCTIISSVHAVGWSLTSVQLPVKHPACRSNTSPQVLTIQLLAHPVINLISAPSFVFCIINVTSSSYIPQESDGEP
ncbi:hypothetical protein KP79_PYT05998 [Mizuhopecten yessoensis]|uniref:Uncharacterized protein n=1 Tax=Mizuhopecten yessoensis TaxID=6573 RepID=A0A210PMS9_MIZYE|nr:hypothetical protein KP79_PYT05998 [Mizuhopecten yessoensis]